MLEPDVSSPSRSGEYLRFAIALLILVVLKCAEPLFS
jgi:hypothetical protein